MTMLEWVKKLRALNLAYKTARSKVYWNQPAAGRDEARQALLDAEAALREHADAKPAEPQGTNWSRPEPPKP